MGSLSEWRRVYPTWEHVEARVEALKKHGIWPGARAVNGGFALTYNPDLPTHLPVGDKAGYGKEE